ncbi:MAG: hypothetical protein IPL84_11190 [Chitinophagaceae bacterium]|nr:hypothetical protein [Chitinophagaceae bacterium]
MKYLLLLVLFPLSALSQSFEKSKEEYLNESYIRYYDRTAGIIIQKTAPLNYDSGAVFYEVALLIEKYEKSINDVMRKRGMIFFEDKTSLILNDPVYFEFLMEGKRQYSIKHRLTEEELELLQTKKIDLIYLMGSTKKLDKWQRQAYLKMFSEIIKQKY